MLAFIIHTRTAWDDYFTDNPTLIQSKVYGERQTPSDTRVYVLNCLFKYITSSDNGGALSCASAIYLLVESSSFLSCNTSSNHGGAIYFNNGGGQCVLHEVCGYDCCSTYTSSTSYGQFVHILVNNAATSKSNINYSSITRCVNDRPDAYSMLRLINGKVCCPSVNLSMNKCGLNSGIFCNPFKDSSSVTFSTSYSSFADNNVTVRACIHTWMTGANCEIKSCNIIRNTQNSINTAGIVYTNDNMLIEDSCILENIATYILSQGSSSYRITLSNCTVDSTSNSGCVTIQSTVTKSFIHALSHMATQNCHSEYDAVGTLTPIIQHSKKPRHYCTCCNYFSYCQIRDLISLVSVFLFNFIHLNASFDHWC
jgi:hypothetical protein